MTNNKQQPPQENPNNQFSNSEPMTLAQKVEYVKPTEMTNNKQQTAVEIFWNQLPEILPFTVDTATAVKLDEAYQQAKEIEKDQMEAAIIKDCATDSTSAAHKFSVFREQIIEAFDQGVIAEFTHQVTGAPETSAEEYFNQTYGNGIQ